MDISLRSADEQAALTHTLFSENHTEQQPAVQSGTPFWHIPEAALALHLKIINTSRARLVPLFVTQRKGAAESTPLEITSPLMVSRQTLDLCAAQSGA